MVATPLAPSSAPNPQQLAAMLWTFVHAKTARFSPETAIEVVESLQIEAGEPVKVLAKRVRAALHAKGVAMKHTNALAIAAQLLGHESAHAPSAKAPALLILHRLTTIATSIESPQSFNSWQEAMPALIESCKVQLLAERRKIIHVHAERNYLSFATSAPDTNSSVDPTHVFATLGRAWSESDWFNGVTSALEHLRRHLEMSGAAILDGFAVVNLCDRPRPLVPNPSFPSLTALDASNSELVVERADNELRNGYEIARGDEIACWTQLLNAAEDANEQALPEFSVDEDGAWHVMGGRYVWHLVTLQPTAPFVPGLVHNFLGVDDSRKLFARFTTFRRIIGAEFPVNERSKKLDVISGPATEYRVNLHRLLSEMKKQGLTWESYCNEVGPQDMVPNLPTGFIFGLLQRLKLADPNVVFARPNRSEMVRCVDDSVLRALLPRVDFVLYRIPSTLEADAKAAAQSAIEQFTDSFRVQKMSQTGMLKQADPLPHLVYGSDAEELRLALHEAGLVAYAAVMPRLFPAPEILEKLPQAWPFAFGHSLFLDIDTLEGGRQ